MEQNESADFRNHDEPDSILQNFKRYNKNDEYDYTRATPDINEVKEKKKKKKSRKSELPPLAQVESAAEILYD